jgi:very-short-patch-repair endonuclease
MTSKYDDKLFKGASPQIFENAKELRKASTAVEDLLWQELRNRKLAGLKFRRQHPLNNYIADFYCSEKQLVIEVDCDIHNKPEIKKYDDARTQDLSSMGIQVLRFANNEVENNITDVLQRIEDFINKQQDS